MSGNEFSVILVVVYDEGFGGFRNFLGIWENVGFVFFFVVLGFWCCRYGVGLGICIFVWDLGIFYVCFEEVLKYYCSVGR